ncbi:MAG: biopolymer transporter ExbD [Acidobacteriota bacterium]|nr:biopolymer transporter ExbD [Acidobacteriota bacterium]
MSGGLRADDQEESLTASINTTPLVDVMLVLLIIFLITIPVVTHTVPVALPHEVNRPTTTKPDDIIIAVDKDGNIYWNDRKVTDNDALLAKLKAQATANPQPEVHIRADRDALYEFVGRIVVDCQRAGIERVAFITQPQPRGANTAE